MSEQRVTIFRARRVITLAEDAPEALAVLGDRVVATGGARDLVARFPDAAQVDFVEGVIVPGFNDAHMHLSHMAEAVLNLDLSIKQVRSLDALTTRLRQEAERVPPETWIRGGGYDDAKMLEGRVLTRWDLDAVSRTHPILVVHVAGHWGVVNSKTLELAGIGEKTPDPAGGTFGRDGTGRLNGILFERALFDLAHPALGRHTPIVPTHTLEEKLSGLARAIEMLHAAGLTSVGDALVSPADLALLQEAERRGMLTLRVNMLLAYEHYGHFQALGLRTGFGSTRLRVGGIKAFVDGAIGGRTCLLEEPYEGASGTNGIQTTSTEELRELIRRVHEDGSRICVHANGDRAISILLDQLEAANQDRPRPDAHHRIEHCTIVNDSILRRMRELGAVAVPFATYIHYHGGKLLQWYGAARVARMFAHRSFLDAGVAVAGSSDHPCGPFEPLLAFQSCVTRRGWDGTVLGENQRITPLEALSLYTVGSAYASGEDREKGRLVPGFLADFAVLGDDPLAADPGTLSSIPVRETYVGGARVWSARQLAAARP